MWNVDISTFGYFMQKYTNVISSKINMNLNKDKAQLAHININYTFILSLEKNWTSINGYFGLQIHTSKSNFSVLQKDK